MGLMRLAKTALARKGNAPGDSYIAQAQGSEGDVLTPEVYTLPGIVSCAPDGTLGMFVPFSGRRGVVVATNNYQIRIEIARGETTIYSTTPDGKTVKAQIDLDGEGNIDLNGDSKKFVTYAELNTALQALITALNTAFLAKLDGGGSSPALTLDISAAETQTVRTGG